MRDNQTHGPCTTLLLISWCCVSQFSDNCALHRSNLLLSCSSCEALRKTRPHGSTTQHESLAFWFVRAIGHVVFRSQNCDKNPWGFGMLVIWLVSFCKFMTPWVNSFKNKPSRVCTCCVNGDSTCCFRWCCMSGQRHWVRKRRLPNTLRWRRSEKCVRYRAPRAAHEQPRSSPLHPCGAYHMLQHVATKRYLHTNLQWNRGSYMFACIAFLLKLFESIRLQIQFVWNSFVDMFVVTA